MFLIKKLNQHRRDFTGIYKRENCGHTETIKYCYDDRNFHDNVTPDIKCSKCLKSTTDLKLKPKHIETKYPKNKII